MQNYIVLLRGVNVGGKNKVAMPPLKSALERRGFERVVTYLNSGNVVLDSPYDEAETKAVCEAEIAGAFGLDIVVCVLSAEDLEQALEHAPEWWNDDRDSKHNALFVIPPATAEQISCSVGEGKPEYERVSFYGRIIFWSAPLATFSRTRWSKVVQNKAAYQAITIRNANTVLKLLELSGGRHEEKQA